jgi:hypothetical protein
MTFSYEVGCQPTFFNSFFIREDDERKGIIVYWEKFKTVMQML